MDFTARRNFLFILDVNKLHRREGWLFSNIGDKPPGKTVIRGPVGDEEK
jgi:hypothetical protein